MSKSPIRILLCEDDPNLGKLLSDYLNAKGFVTTWAQDGAEGVKTYFRETFDFVILDVMMPRKDGFEVATEIRKESKSIPILFLTARSMKEDTLEGFKVGADDYMTKPFSMEELLVRINAILRRTSSLPQMEKKSQPLIWAFLSSTTTSKSSLTTATNKNSQPRRMSCFSY